MRLRAVLIAFALSAAALARAEAAATPEAIAADFCDARGSAEQRRYGPLLTASLRELIAAAWKKSDEFEKANPGDKPPLGDGVPFHSYPDSAPICRAGAVVQGTSGVTVDIENAFDSAAGADWTDRLSLKFEDGRLLIDDVLYGPEDYKLGLRSVLQSIIDGEY